MKSVISILFVFASGACYGQDSVKPKGNTHATIEKSDNAKLEMLLKEKYKADSVRTVQLKNKQKQNKALQAQNEAKLERIEKQLKKKGAYASLLN